MWIILSLLAALFSATAAIGEKKILLKEEALKFSLILSIFNFLLIAPYLFRLNSISLESLLIIFFKSILTSLAFLMIMKGLKSLKISSSLPILIFTPLFVALGEYIFFQSILKNIEILAMVIILLGTYLLLLNDVKSPLQPLSEIRKGSYGFLFSAVILFTISSLIDKLIIIKAKVSPLDYISLNITFTAIIFVVIYLIFNKKKQKATLYRSLSPYLILSIITIAYKYFHIMAIKSGGPVSLVLSLKRTSILFATIIGGTIFKEGDLLKKSISVILMLIGASLIVLY